jgi:hypothetical protein
MVHSVDQSEYANPGLVKAENEKYSSEFQFLEKSN